LKKYTGVVLLWDLLTSDISSSDFDNISVNKNKISFDVSKDGLFRSYGHTDREKIKGYIEENLKNNTDSRFWTLDDGRKLQGKNVSVV
jgi:hypothetical protein